MSFGGFDVMLRFKYKGIKIKNKMDHHYITCLWLGVGHPGHDLDHQTVNFNNPFPNVLIVGTQRGKALEGPLLGSR